MSKDANHETICRAFRQAGADVVSLHTLGSGVPDLLIGFAGTERLVEVKLPKRKVDQKESPRTHLSRVQKNWHNSWRGHTPLVVRTPEDAERVLDIMAEEPGGESNV